MTRAAPAWLANFQAGFGGVIRTPLDRATGTLTADVAAYDRDILCDVRNASSRAAEARLAVYNRQYWFRLFEVLQSAFPLTSRVLGYWDFNGVAAGFVSTRPPSNWDVDAVGDGFDSFVASRSDLAAHDVLVEAVRIDAAYRDVFRAPDTPPYRPSAADAGRLLDARLVPSPALRIVEENRPLVLLRRRLLDEPHTVRVTLPTPLERPQRWAILRTDHGTAHLTLEPLEAALFDLLAQYSLRDALGRLEQSCSPAERDALPERTQAWLARSVELGFWSGLFDDAHDTGPLNRR
jgi:hypothetical protein